MTKVTTLLIACLFVITSLFAQQQITTGTSYRKQNFFKLSDASSIVINNTDWDIAFTVYGQTDAGVFLNEAVGSGNPVQLPVRLYKAPSNIFENTVNISEIKDTLYNDEKGWAYGAFNSGRNPADYTDYGWGKYNPPTNEVIGNKVFVIQLRNSTFRKIEIQKLGLGYTFRHANLDGTDEKVVTFKKGDFKGKTLAYFSFSDNMVKNLELADFDILYTRYLTKVEQNGAFLENYPVTGILSGRGVQVAKISGVDPKTINLNNYVSNLNKSIDVIGHDWKTFSLTTNSWTVPSDRVYFVKTAANRYFKLVFIDFEGAATGTASFETEEIKGIISSKDIAQQYNFKVYPTLTTNDLNIVFDNNDMTAFEITITNMAGQTISNHQIDIAAGFQVKTMNVSDLSVGAYIVTLKSANGFATAKFVKI
jgi:hypothetical protein